MPNPHRRKFLAETAIALAAAPFISTSATREKSKQSRKLGVAVWGLGRLSGNQIEPALEETAYCRPAGIVPGTPGKARAWEAE